MLQRLLSGYHGDVGNYLNMSNMVRYGVSRQIIDPVINKKTPLGLTRNIRNEMASPRPYHLVSFGLFKKFKRFIRAKAIQKVINFIVVEHRIKCQNY